LPVPDSPKNTATSPFAPTFTAACMGRTPSSGRRKFMIPKAPFFISPAYSVPAMMISWRDRWTRMTVSLCVPSRRGSAWNDGASMIVKLGTKSSSCSAVGWMNRLSQKMLAQAVSV